MRLLADENFPLPTGAASQKARIAGSPARGPGEEICAFCRCIRNVEVGHLDGHEENPRPDNLLWNCRLCNIKLGVFKRRRDSGILNGGNTANSSTRRGPVSDNQREIEVVFGPEGPGKRGHEPMRVIRKPAVSQSYCRG
jgi:hypothetical protein